MKNCRDQDWPEFSGYPASYISPSGFGTAVVHLFERLRGSYAPRTLVREAS